jgi:pyruvate dehydrogenase E2 component (dihydrolipoamide acetyltransferase)
MANELLMPKLGMAQSYCIVEKWLKKPGDKINKGDVVVEVSTDKVTYEVESKFDGYLLKITRQEGEEVPVHEVIAYIGQPGEEISAPGSFSEMNVEDSSTIAKKTGPGALSGELLISPLAKKIITDNNLDANKITGSGPGGRIMKEDVLDYMKKNSGAAKQDPAQDKTKQAKNMPQVLRIIKLEGIRKIIAEKMVFSKQNIPHISQSVDADVTDLVLFKKNIEKNKPEKITYSDLLIKAVAIALKANPGMNSAYIEEQQVIYKDINIGLVTSVENGLIIPVIRNCNQLSIEEIATKRNELISQAREGKITIENISGGTFTITNLGMLNVRYCTAIIYPPQVAILSVGGIFPTMTVVSNDKTDIRKIMDITITEDHRVLDGVAGARFLMSLKEILENPDIFIK